MWQQFQIKKYSSDIKNHAGVILGCWNFWDPNFFMSFIALFYLLNSSEKFTTLLRCAEQNFSLKICAVFFGVFLITSNSVFLRN